MYSYHNLYYSAFIASMYYNSVNEILKQYFYL